MSEDVSEKEQIDALINWVCDSKECGNESRFLRTSLRFGLDLCLLRSSLSSLALLLFSLQISLSSLREWFHLMILFVRPQRRFLLFLPLF